MQAGKLNREITFQTIGDTPDANGYQIETWSDYKTLWAEVLVTGSREFYAAQQINAETSAVFKLWQRKDLTTAMRVEWGSRYFGILGIIPVGKDEMQVLARELV